MELNKWNDKELDLLYKTEGKTVINRAIEFKEAGFNNKGDNILLGLIEVPDDSVMFVSTEELIVENISQTITMDPEWDKEAPPTWYMAQPATVYIKDASKEEAYDTYRTSLIIPDCHDKPGHDKTRFEKLGQLIVERRPDRIFQMGDFSSLSSLSHWDRNKKLTIEGKRYKEDIKSANETIALIFGPLKKLQEAQRKAGANIYSPEIIWILGNHCDWVRQYTVYNPAMSGYLDLVEDLGLMSFCSEIVQYREFIERDGVIFSHVPMNGANTPVSGKYSVFKAQESCSMSQVFAHTHRWEHIAHKRHGDNDITQTMSAGFFDTEKEEYCEGAPLGWWAGITILTHWKHGRFDCEQISLERLIGD